MSLLGVSDQIDVMKSLIVDTCGKSALRDYEKTYSLLPGEKAASEMGEREEEKDDKKYMTFKDMKLLIDAYQQWKFEKGDLQKLTKQFLLDDAQS